MVQNKDERNDSDGVRRRTRGREKPQRVEEERRKLVRRFELSVRVADKGDNTIRA